MGLGLTFAEGEGPRFAHPVRDEAAVAALAVPDMDKLRYVFDAVTSIRQALAGRVPLIGFSGSPWTLACYMVEGAGTDDYRLVKTMLYARPDLLHRILAINAEAVAALPERADRRRRAGGDGVRQLGRRAGRWRVPGLQPGLHASGCWQLKRERAACRASSSPRAAGRGWRRSPPAAPTWWASTGRSTWRRRARARAATAWRCRATSTRWCCSAAKPRCAARRGAVLDGFGAPQRADGGRDGHIFNLGHGISQHTPPESRGRAGRGGSPHSRTLTALAGAAGK